MVMSRAALAEVGPLWLGALRYGLALLVLVPVVLALRPAPLRRGDLLPVLGLGLLQFGLIIVLLNWALLRLGAAEATLLFSTAPVLTVLLAAATGREPLDGRRLAGAGLTVAGVAVTLGALPSGADLAGAAAALGAALTAAVTAVATGPYLRRNPTLRVGVVAMTASALPLVLAALAVEGIPAVPGAAGLALVGGIGLLSGAGYLVWLTALRHAEAGEATVVMALAPLAAAALSALALHEQPSPGLLPGAALALAGVALAVRRRGRLRLAEPGRDR